MFKITDEPIRRLTVLYDSSCGFCVACRRWLERQPAYVRLVFVPAGTAAARAAGGADIAGEELVAIAADGRIYRGASAWIMCLYALTGYREWAVRLARPALAPFAKQAFRVLSSGRHRLSRALRLLPEPELARELAAVPAAACAAGGRDDDASLPAPASNNMQIVALVFFCGLLAAALAPWISTILADRPWAVPAPAAASPLPGKEYAMPYILATYFTYLALSVGLTVWVARTLHKNGRIFLVDSFAGNETLADSVNRLLVVGFYLINIGYVSLALKESRYPTNTASSLEQLSSKVGLVLLVLGGMHFFNLYVFSRLRRRGLLRNLPPPVPHDGRITGADPAAAASGASS